MKFNAYKNVRNTFNVSASSDFVTVWNINESGNWYENFITIFFFFYISFSKFYRYDLSVSLPDFDPFFLRRFAGRMETGFDSITDPAMA